MTRDLSRLLHSLTSRLDRAADRILRAECGVTYSRFLALYAVGELAGPSQRTVAAWLGVTEPSASRMTRALQDAGWLKAQPALDGGNRRRLVLTPQGRELVQVCGTLLEDRFAALTGESGVAYDEYRRGTVRLLETLSSGGPTGSREDGASPAGRRAAVDATPFP